MNINLKRSKIFFYERTPVALQASITEGYLV